MVQQMDASRPARGKCKFEFCGSTGGAMQGAIPKIRRFVMSAPLGQENGTLFVRKPMTQIRDSHPQTLIRCPVWSDS